MNLTKIRYFIEVARCGNFSEAARRLYTAQPNVSKQIAQMEQELDFSLFVRSKRAVKLTPAGQLLYDRLKDLPDAEWRVEIEKGGKRAALEVSTLEEDKGLGDIPLA